MKFRAFARYFFMPVATRQKVDGIPEKHIKFVLQMTIFMTLERRRYLTNT